MNKAIFLDRDGTINIEKNYLYKIESFEFIKGVPQTIKILNENDYKAIVITNQSGVARNFYTESDIKTLHDYINNELKKYNASIDDFYYCPHHPDHKCMCRKPNIGLFLNAIEKWNIDCNLSYVVGDKITDLIPGKKLGMKTILVETGYGKQQIFDEKFCNYRVKNLNQIIKILGK